MNRAGKSGSKQLTEFNRTQIARAIFAEAASMGISDRRKVERLTSQVIERVERPQTLPGMEDLVPQPRRRHWGLPTSAEIQTMVMEILMAEEPAQKKEAKPIASRPERRNLKIREKLMSDTQPKRGKRKDFRPVV